jgi:Spy/CpxP family protein refolding chaperone
MGDIAMRWTVSLCVAFLGVALLVGSSDGQGEGKKSKDGKAIMPAGWKDLDLTAVQREKLTEVTSKYNAKLKALAEQETALKAELKAEQYKILTSEQKDKLIKKITGESAPKEKAATKEKDKK